MLRDEIMVEISVGDRSLAAGRAVALRAACAVGFGDDDPLCIVSAISEACVNAVTHGRVGSCNGSALLCIRMYDDKLEAVVKDFGKGFTCPVDTPIPSPIAHRGRGIPLMRTFMDEVRFEVDGGCKVTLVKYLPGKNPS